jgi:hypothetical protein
MANTLRIKRRAAGGSAGAPASLANAELAFNEQDNTLYYGTGTGGAGGTATSVIAIGGPGAFVGVAGDEGGLNEGDVGAAVGDAVAQENDALSVRKGSSHLSRVNEDEQGEEKSKEAHG